MTKPRSNTRRFVNAAWSLLTFQVIASAGAVGVTAYAAFHVQQIAAQLEQASAGGHNGVDDFGDRNVGPEDQNRQSDSLGEGEITPPPPPPPIPLPDQEAQMPPSIPRCSGGDGRFRVDANVGWCATDVQLQAEQYIAISAEGRWSNVGPPSEGPGGSGPYDGTVLPGAPIASLIGSVGGNAFAIGTGRVVRVPASGLLLLSINDVPGTFEDNQGYVVVQISFDVIP